HRRRPGRWSIGVAVDVPRATEGRGDRRIARALIEWASLPEGGDPRHHQTRIDRVERLPTQSPALEDAGTEIFKNNVAVGNDPSHDLLALRRAEIERHELLVPVVHGEPVGAVALRRAEAP